MKRVLVDTGPLVAIFAPRDLEHQRCVDQLSVLPGPLLSCWPVITEAAWLLRQYRGAIQRLLGSIDIGFLALLPLADSETKPIIELLNKYEDMQAQLADVALVYLAGREDIGTIFTLDRRDFSVYRYGRNRAFTILPGARST
jgi:uncharacterized protein